LSAVTEFGQFLKTHPQTKYLDAFYCDLSCVIRGKRYPVAEAGKVFESGMMSPGSSFLLAVTGESMDPEGLGFSDGDPDQLAVPVSGTLAPAPWTQIPTAQVMLTLQGLDGEPYYYEPRNVLARVLQRFAGLGLRPVVAFELEFYLFAADQLQPPHSPLTGQRNHTTQVYSLEDVEDFALYLDEVVSTCALQGVTTGAISAEYSPGQFEINLKHSDHPMEAADHCVLFRRAVQGIARKRGYRATFMAKPRVENSGNGLHLHVSLLDQQGNNVFDGKGEYGTLQCVSEALAYSIGGLTDIMAESMGIFAPNINSYDRFVPNTYTPVTASWGFENRSVAIRIPKSPGAARRIEHRVAGADANPYLTLAAILAGMYHGITRQISPGPPSEGNAGSVSDSDIPFDLTEAQTRSRQSRVLSDCLGEKYIRAYTRCKLNEYRGFIESGDTQSHWYL